MRLFQNLIQNCGFHDSGCEGYRFTWSNKKNDPYTAEEWLDRSLVNSVWRIIWKDATVCTLIGKKESDHNLIRFDFCRQIGSKERSNKMEKTIQINLRRFG